MPVAIAVVSAADKQHALVVAEVETLRMRIRALSAANTNLRRRIRDLLASQHVVSKTPDVAAC